MKTETPIANAHEKKAKSIAIPVFTKKGIKWNLLFAKQGIPKNILYSIVQYINRLEGIFRLWWPPFLIFLMRKMDRNIAMAFVLPKMCKREHRTGIKSNRPGFGSATKYYNTFKNISVNRLGMGGRGDENPTRHGAMENGCMAMALMRHQPATVRWHFRLL